MKIRGGRLKKQIEIEAGTWDHVEIPCREGSTISVDASEVDGDDFSVYILDSAQVKTTLLTGRVSDYEDDKALWKKEKVKKVSKKYTVDARDIYYVIFDNYHAKSKYKLIDIDVDVEHPPLEVDDEPLQESFEVDAGYLETIDLTVNAGDTVRAFGRVTKGNDITVHILSKLYETPDTIHTDKAYFTKEKVEEINLEYHAQKSESLLLVFDNVYSLRTAKTIDVSVQVLKGAKEPDGQKFCKFCGAKIDADAAFCQHCGGKL
ncbi:MAG: zinc ribbon domain-containing protein [Candidatus Thorarchaeota archaeon]